MNIFARDRQAVFKKKKSFGFCIDDGQFLLLMLLNYFSAVNYKIRLEFAIFRFFKFRNFQYLFDINQANRVFCP